MMNIRRYFNALCGVVLIVALSACIPSLHGIADPDDMIGVDGLPGIWDGPNGIVLTIVAAQQDGRYQVSYQNEHDDQITLQVGFTEINDVLYADVVPAYPTSFQRDDILTPLLIDVHTIMAVDMSDDQNRLSVRTPSLGWMLSHLDTNPASLAHTFADGLILTAHTAQLRSFVAANPALFDTDAFHFNRQN